MSLKEGRGISRMELIKRWNDRKRRRVDELSTSRLEVFQMGIIRSDGFNLLPNRCVIIFIGIIFTKKII